MFWVLSKEAITNQLLAYIIEKCTFVIRFLPPPPPRFFPFFLSFFFFLLLCALGTPWACNSAAFPEKVRQCRNAAVW